MGKRGKEIISMKNGEKTNIEKMTKQSVYSVQCEKEISEENNDIKVVNKVWLLIIVVKLFHISILNS